MEKDKNVVADACSDKDGSSNENTSISFTDLSTFVLKRILSENSQKKTIIAEGSFSDQEGTAILFLEKTPFNEELLKCLCSTESTLEEQLCNDIYRFYTCNPELKYGGFKATIIFPATEKHVKKYEIQPLHLIEETSKLYYEVTLPHITSESFNIQWVYNILTHQQEQESIVFEDPDPNLGFVLVPDLKWDKNQVSNLYLLAIIHRHNIKSLRDLTDEHLPLLKNIQEKGSKVIEEKYGLQRSRLRIYFHYRPSYYHLHVHFTHIQFEAPGIHTEKSHLLSTVISNIEMNSKYYQLCTLPMVIKESEKLFLLFKDLGLVKESEVTEQRKQEVSPESTE